MEDILAFSDGDELIVFGECTLRELDVEKLDKLTARAQAFDAQMAKIRGASSAGHGCSPA